MLYPTELRAEILPDQTVCSSCPTKAAQPRPAARDSGRGERIRTSDILLPKQALYQAELRPGQQRIIPHCQVGCRSQEPVRGWLPGSATKAVRVLS